MTVYYVSPTGSDSQTGAIERPFASLQHAHDLAQPGDTIYLRGGVYALTDGIQLTRDGTSGAPITIANYPGETPVLDGSGMTSTEYYGRTGAGGWVLDGSSVSWNHIVGLEIRGGPMGGFVLRDESHNNVVEQLDVHDNGRGGSEGKGISVFGASSNNLFLNNDSHDNRDLAGDNADGFQVSTSGAGNVLRGNRAWGNSDDGFDFFNIADGTRNAPVRIEGNWAFDNGYGPNGEVTGDGNGFKLGGIREGSGGSSGGHTVIDNVAWGNRSIGFDENGGTGTTLRENTAYDNGAYNYGFFTGTGSLYDNSAFGEGRVAASGTASGNSWDAGAASTSNDFASLEGDLGRADRRADGSLPFTDEGAAAATPDTGSAPAPEIPGSSAGGITPAPVAPAAPAPSEPVATTPPVPTPSEPAPAPASVITAKQYGTEFADSLQGTAGNDYIHGNSGADRLAGGAGNDELRGGSENDRLTGGLGADLMHGGDGQDTFVFKTADESGVGPGQRDITQWFQQGADSLDLSLIDANTAIAGDQLFKFAGETHSVEANAVSFVREGSSTVLQGDINGDSTADFQIELNSKLLLHRSDFAL
jgi:Ca2+-binding RTX toxin-like protein